jgi:anti-sigma factor RsiW
MTINSDPQLNDTDLELLSAYIDRRLSDDERAALEQRLKSTPALRSALDELRATVALLRDLEPLKPPRSFTIEAPAAAPRRGWAFPWRAFGSGLIALVCLLAFSFVLIRGSGGGGGAGPAPPGARGAPAPAPPPPPHAPPAAGAAGGAAAYPRRSARRRRSARGSQPRRRQRRRQQRQPAATCLPQHLLHPRFQPPGRV